jgi:hypothetical protein
VIPILWNSRNINYRIIVCRLSVAHTSVANWITEGVEIGVTLPGDTGRHDAPCKEGSLKEVALSLLVGTGYKL